MTKHIQVSIVVSCLAFGARVADAADYYVTQNGAGSRNGLSSANAWSVDDFDSASNWSTSDDDSPTRIDPGDTVYFSGTFTSKINPQGSGTSGNYITLDGYETDDTTYMNLSEAPGRALFDLTQARTPENVAVDLDNKDYINVVDFEFTDLYEAIGIGGTSSYVTIQRCYGHTLSRNLVHIGIGTSITVGGSSGHGCVAKNVGQGTADADIVTVNMDNLVISYNHLYADSSNYGTDGITLHSTNDVLIEYNSIHGHNDAVGMLGENGIDIKQDSYNIIVRYNKIYDHAYESGIILNGRTSPPQSADQVYIYGNYFYDNTPPGVHSQSNSGESYDDIYIFSNIFRGMGNRAISLSQSGSYTIFNNIIAENSMTGSNSYDAGVYIGGSGATLKNNIYYKNRPGDTSYRQLSVGIYCDTDTISDYNRYYWPGQASIFRWGDAGTVMTLPQIKNGNTEGLPQEGNGSEGDPGLVDLAGYDYRINSVSSAVVDAGVDMGSGPIATVTVQGQEYPINWDVGLGPNTDWSGTIPVMDLVGRDTLGWDQGAYAYVPIDIVPPAAPQNLQIQ